ncbi:MAG: FAD:protein FMN transferase [Acidobacteria bacterium]|nr:FAD:protein FMN transferase [Acidobacteriota bacterium]
MSLRRESGVCWCFAKGRLLVVATIALGGALVAATDLSPVGAQRYVMGTMFEIIVYHPVRPAAERAVHDAMTEIVRLDQVMSHYKEDSDLSKLNRSTGRDFVVVDAALYDVVDRSLSFSRLSDGRFDVTVGPLVQLWKRAHGDGHRPSAEEIAAAKRCVGYRNIETGTPNRLRLRSDCVAIDLGGIGKGYAVERAIDILKAQGILDAMVNAGGSTIAVIGAPPGREGWPVRIGAPVRGSSTLLLRDAAISTSQQSLATLPLETEGFGEIVDPDRGVPIQDRASVSVITANATTSDALSTALLLTPLREAPKLLEHFPDASALWMSPGGTLQAEYRASRLRPADSR